MKRVIVLAVVAVLLIVTLGATIFIINNAPTSTSTQDKTFYVGVTYCGNTTSGSKLLIDKVKNYTNLFVLQSGSLQRNNTAMNEVGDYAIASGLHFAVYSGVDAAFQSTDWINAAKQRWGSQFLGIYYNDEPGGKMLDSYSQMSLNGSNIIKLGSGGIEIGVNGTDLTYAADGTVTATTTYQSDLSDAQNGTLHVTYPNGTVTDIPNNVTQSTNQTDYLNSTYTSIPAQINSTTVTYCPNGTITIRDEPENILYTAENGSAQISHVEPYAAVLAENPMSNCNEAAQTFISSNRASLDWLSNESVTVFTSDYALYWWDYQSGYDVVLAELGWNNTAAQEIGLVRGAANLQDKNWGTIITWTYTQPPYLTSGDEMYNEMRLSYESGTDYVIVFNYAQDMNSPYGTLQPEHFQALERFWNEVVQNRSVVHGGIKAEAAFVLPKNYGWGMRNPNDTIWGLWNTNSTSEQIWTQLQSKIAQYGSKLDIVYDDPAYPVAGKYSQIIYWNQTT